MGTADSCGLYTKNSTVHFLQDVYAGIPENLIINLITWVVVLILFTILRKIAWDYGRIALVSRNEENVCLNSADSRYNVWTTLFYGEHDRRSMAGSQESLDTTLSRIDKGICSWIPAFFKVRDADILRKSGRDAIQYLTFQRYLLAYLFVICVLSIAVVLPVNFQGNLIGNASDFGHTTIANLESGSPLLWLHVFFAVLYLIIAIIIMRFFSINLQYDEDEQVTRTLMISNIPKDKCFKNIITQHFQEAYSESEVIDVQFAYNIAQLVKLDQKRQKALEGRINSEMEFSKTKSRPLIRPYVCGVCCCCDCCCKQVDAIEYYTNEEMSFKDACESEKVTAYQEPLGIAFVTFQTDHMAERTRADFRSHCKSSHNPQPSTVYREIDAPEWEVKYAPSPENIYWENLSVSPLIWWIKALLINAFVVILLFFLTTPAIIMNTLDQINYEKVFKDAHNVILVQFFPTLLLWLFSALLPNIVYYSDQYIGHWTRTAEHHAVMRKTFLFLIVMVLILPSLGLTSAKAFVEWAILEKEHKYRWECIFLSGNGAFFVNYVITSAFIGTSLEIIRFPELFMYGLRLLLARSSAERTAVRKSVLWEFQFGAQYAWMLCIFAVTVTYSIPCPLIAPFGLVYLGLKHLVDRYNIYFAYGPSKIDKHIHSTAINFVLVSIILLQFCIVFFIGLKAEFSDPVFIIATVGLFLTLLIFIGRLSFGWFKHCSYWKYKQFGEGDAFASDGEREINISKPFVANVLLDKKEAMDGLSSNKKNYGATEPMSIMGQSPDDEQEDDVSD